ncbi:MAG: TrkA C-terminal domain-containing protein [Candidatus Omnitrophica bacterium]|nr:TrkA C-terminal domain-containing protein [Candidatus Omnitrophota bacterium]
MVSMILLIPVIIVIIISVVVVKIGSVALSMTGMSESKAHFQALSAFSGTGFTTRDSELIMEDGIRRKIIMVLMILGNAGYISVITTMVLSFAKGGIKPTLVNSSILIVALLIIYKIASHKRITRFFTRKIQSYLEKKDVFKRMPIEEIKLVSSDYGIAEVKVKSTFSDVGKPLIESHFREKDILVLAIERKQGIIPTPKATDVIQADDILVCYGRLENLEKIV